ncbi:hypothetical protein SKAU_G00383950 [Synaphobranchus kaupii]|uniref:Vesicle-associated membrane protein-associated protein A n=1 Tax=Synaphobranchus kaupii TaxID=118154 RepID=A0A9Q1EE89_SYNKA|nr:hypothetical protein SKAU_G00383950 [Synaphobranchus kaupii]
MSKLEQILILDPPSDLKFKGPFTEVVTTSLSLKNPSERPVCFKVKTTAPRRYCVRPNSGLVEPGTAVIISVMLQPFEYDPNEKSKHKFMVQTIFAPPGASDMEALWKAAKPEDLMDSKLRCVFELPTENDKMSDAPAESSKEGPVLNAGDGPAATPKPSGLSAEDGEMRSLKDECKRLHAEAGRLADENRQLKDDGLRMRKAQRSDNVMSNTGGAMARDNGSTSLPSLLVIIAAIFIGFFLGKFIL